MLTAEERAEIAAMGQMKLDERATGETGLDLVEPGASSFMD